MEKYTGLKHLFATMFLYNFAVFLVVPSITDVTMEALCPGQEECSLVIYLSGFHQAVTGVVSLFVTPLVGNLSDRFGRKALLTVPMTITVIPLDYFDALELIRRRLRLAASPPCFRA